jgi:hypothetical protein
MCLWLKKKKEDFLRIFENVGPINNSAVQVAFPQEFSAFKVYFPISS